jgi:hypothetical protein
MAYACFVNPVNAVTEKQFLLSKELPTQITANEIL